jgi:hypothetical protein
MYALARSLSWNSTLITEKCLFIEFNMRLVVWMEKWKWDGDKLFLKVELLSG